MHPSETHPAPTQSLGFRIFPTNCASCEIDTCNHTRHTVQCGLLKSVCEVMFPTQQSLVHFAQSLYPMFAPHIRDMLIIKGGCIIDHYLDQYRATDLDLEIANTDVYRDMHRFLIKNNFDYLEGKSILLVDRNCYKETPIGDLSLVCDNVNEFICAHSDEIIQVAKTVLFNLLGTDEHFPMYSRRMPELVTQFSRQAIHELSLGDMAIKLAYADTPLRDQITMRIGKQLNIAITCEPSNMIEPDQFLSLYVVDICVGRSSVSRLKTVSIYSFRMETPEYYLIDCFETTVQSFSPFKLKRRLERLQKLIDLVLSKHLEISESTLKELFDCGTNVIDPYKFIGTRPLIGQSGNIYNITSSINTDIGHHSNTTQNICEGNGLIAVAVKNLTMTDLELTCNYLPRMSFEPHILSTISGDIRKHIQNNIASCFRLITQSPYFDQLRR